MMVLLYPCFLSGCSVLTILDAAENVSAPVCFGLHTYSYSDSPHGILLNFPQFLYIIAPMYDIFNLVVSF